MRPFRAVCLLACGLALLAPSAGSADEPSGPPKAETFRLRYKFRPGETVRWEVEQQAQIRTTVSGTTQTAETTTTSTKAWKITNVDPQGAATFVHSVEAIDMRHKLTGRQEVRYNSRTDKEVPDGFQDAAKSVGVPLTEITMDATGKVLKREEKRPSATNPNSQITLPLPGEAVAVGHVWHHPYEVSANAKDGSVKKIKVQQRLTLVDVKNGVATIKIETQVLTPIHDPQIEAQLVQGDTNGTIRFDVDAGRLLGMQTDLDKHVVGFQGESSSMHYLMRLTEKLLPPSSATAAKPKVVAGPVAPPQPPATPPATSPAARPPESNRPAASSAPNNRPSFKRR